MMVNYGYFGITNVTVKTMLIQDILNFFKHHQFSDWRCVIHENAFVQAIVVNKKDKTIVICPLFCKFTDYRRASFKLRQVLEEYENPFYNPRNNPYRSFKLIGKYARNLCKNYSNDDVFPHKDSFDTFSLAPMYGKSILENDESIFLDSIVSLEKNFDYLTSEEIENKGIFM